MLSYATTYYILNVMHPRPSLYFFFFFNDTATTEIYTLSLHDALPISTRRRASARPNVHLAAPGGHRSCRCRGIPNRSEEHTSELQSQSNLVCRLLLEKKKKNTYQSITIQRAYPQCSSVAILYSTVSVS